MPLTSSHLNAPTGPSRTRSPPLERDMSPTSTHWKPKTSVRTLTASLLRFYPHFSTFLTHVTSHALSFHATYPVHPACASKSRDLFLLTSHSRALSYSLMPLFGSLRLCRGFLSRSSDSFVYDSLVPFSTIHLPHLACFLIPIDVTGTSCFTFIRGPMLLSLIQYYT